MKNFENTTVVGIAVADPIMMERTNADGEIKHYLIVNYAVHKYIGNGQERTYMQTAFVFGNVEGIAKTMKSGAEIGFTTDEPSFVSESKNSQYKPKVAYNVLASKFGFRNKQSAKKDDAQQPDLLDVPAEEDEDMPY